MFQILSKRQKNSENNNKKHGVYVRAHAREGFFLCLVKITASYSSLAAGTPAHLNIINSITPKKKLPIFSNTDRL